MKIILGPIHASFVMPYAPAGSRHFYSRYRNGIPIRLGNAALHVWRLRDGR